METDYFPRLSKIETGRNNPLCFQLLDFSPAILLPTAKRGEININENRDFQLSISPPLKGGFLSGSNPSPRGNGGNWKQSLVPPPLKKDEAHYPATETVCPSCHLYRHSISLCERERCCFSWQRRGREDRERREELEKTQTPASKGSVMAAIPCNETGSSDPWDNAFLPGRSSAYVPASPRVLRPAGMGRPYPGGPPQEGVPDTYSPSFGSARGGKRPSTLYHLVRLTKGTLWRR
jgi:hypothetical protein